MKPEADGPQKRYWLDDPRNVTKVFYTVVGVCASLLLFELVAVVVLHLFHKHTHFDWEGWFGFHAFYGFCGSVFLVLTAKQLRRLLMRDEDYYDR